MFASISHDLRTPCNAALNGLFLLKSRLKPEDYKNFAIVESSIKFLLILVNDTLDFAQMESGTFKMNFEEIKLLNNIEEVV